MRGCFLLKNMYARICLAAVLVCGLILSASSAVLAEDDIVLAEVRTLIQDKYVEPVSADVLNSSTVEELLEKLGDRHTEYFTEEEYEGFAEGINMQFVGIGIHFNMEDEGVRVVSVIAGSPAEDVGLQAGDLIVSGDGEPLAGLTSNEAANLLRGVEDSTVKIEVERDAEILTFNVTRRMVSEATATGKVLAGHIGYLDINSFGSDTKEFRAALDSLRDQNVDSWIVDLRDNGGGYLTSVLDIAGYFVGPEYVFRITDRTGNVQQYQAEDHGFTLEGPLVLLINGESASASELLAAAIRDYRRGTIVGTTSYGKGSVQTMFNLSDGGVLKLTVNHFYSPFGNQINGVGITPDMEIKEADSRKAAELLLMKESEAPIRARAAEYWGAWGELVNYMPSVQELETYAWYYSDYLKVNEMPSIPLDKKFTVTFSEAVDWVSVHRGSVELIDSETGERTAVEFKVLNASEIQVIPQEPLDPDTVYWLVIHPFVQDLNGLGMKSGIVVVAHTVEEATGDAEGD